MSSRGLTALNIRITLHDKWLQVRDGPKAHRWALEAEYCDLYKGRRVKEIYLSEGDHNV